jgi:hypothetical protein
LYIYIRPGRMQKFFYSKNRERKDRSNGKVELTRV